jgi:hypothetical protein
MKTIIFIAALLISGSAWAGSIQGNLKLEPSGTATNAAMIGELRLDSERNDQLLLWIWAKNGGWAQRSSLPVEPVIEDGATVYRFATPIREAGMYYARATVGPGQAGYVGFFDFYANPKTPSSVFVSMRNQFEDAVPAYVQPVGYAVFGVVALFAFGLSAIVLRRLASTQQA